MLAFTVVMRRSFFPSVLQLPQYQCATNFLGKADLAFDRGPSDLTGPTPARLQRQIMEALTTATCCVLRCMHEQFPALASSPPYNCGKTAKPPTSMVLLTMTPLLVEALQKRSAEPCPDVRDTKDAPSLKSPAAGNPISHAQVVDLWRDLRELDAKYSLENLLKSSRVYIAPPPPKPEPVGSTHLFFVFRIRKGTNLICPTVCRI